VPTIALTVNLQMDLHCQCRYETVGTAFLVSLSHKLDTAISEFREGTYACTPANVP